MNEIYHLGESLIGVASAPGDMALAGLRRSYARRDLKNMVAR